MNAQDQNLGTSSVSNACPKKHKKHKKEKEDRDEKPQLKLILKAMSEKYACVGSNNTPEHQGEFDQPMMIDEKEQGVILDPNDPNYALYRAHHKKSKKKKKKKEKSKDRDRERRHKHHHKEKKRKKDELDDAENPDAQGNQNECFLPYSECTITATAAPYLDMDTSLGVYPSLDSPGIHREPRTCVIKKNQEKPSLSKALEHLLGLLEKKDTHNFFAWPVTEAIAPGYSKIISKPMDFSTMRQKIEDNQYNNFKEFDEDFQLMCENAMKYNHVDTVYYKASKKLLLAGQKILQQDKLDWILQVAPDLTDAELGFEVTPEMRCFVGKTEDAETTVKAENEEALTPEEILSRARAAARLARARLKGFGPSMGYLKARRDGSAQLSILVGNNMGKKKSVASLGSLVGRLNDGTASLQGFKEDRRNVARPVKPLYYGAYGSYAPSHDSAFANLTKEESALVLRAYGSDQAVQYAESIQDFVKGCDYSEKLVDSLLDILTGGEHSKTKASLEEGKNIKDEEEAVRTVLESTRVDTVKVNLNELKTLNELGIDVAFLNNMEEEIRQVEERHEMQEKLNDMCQLLEKLQKTQYERLSQPLSVALINIPAPTKEECSIAEQCAEGLVDISKKVSPGAIAPVPAIRRALGVALTTVPEPEPDLETELRQFLEQAQEPAHLEADNAIDDILMD